MNGMNGVIKLIALEVPWYDSLLNDINGTRLYARREPETQENADPAKTVTI